MSIVTKKPPIIETVGAQYVCFNEQTDNKEWSNQYNAEVEKTKVVKSVKVTENAETSNVYASGEMYDSDTSTSHTDIEVSVIAFPADTLAKMRGEVVDAGGLHLSGGKGERPYFAYGKVVKSKGGDVRFEWYPKCKLASNTDDASTKEDKFSEQPATIVIRAYPFNENEDCRAYVDSSASNFPEGLTEEMFFAKPILTPADLLAAVPAKEE